jgi:hypothetical protein
MWVVAAYGYYQYEYILQYISLQSKIFIQGFYQSLLLLYVVMATTSILYRNLLMRRSQQV